MSLSVCPMPIKTATRFVGAWHRHHRPPTGALFAVGCWDSENVRGVAIIGRPVARKLDDGWTVEVTRCATDGARNACSLLYGAAWRAAKELGYRRMVTYTLPSEGGASLRAVGWRRIQSVGGGEWSRPSRSRPASENTEIKVRWEVGEVCATIHPSRRGEP